MICLNNALLFFFVLPQAGGLRNSNAATFTPLKKASHFFQFLLCRNRSKEASYVVTGGNAVKRIFKCYKLCSILCLLS